MDLSTKSGSNAASAGVNLTWKSHLGTLALASLALLVVGRQARAQSRLVGFGATVYDSAWNDETFVELALGSYFTAARRSDGSVVVWGRNDAGQAQVPELPIGLTYVALAAGHEPEGFSFSYGGHALALRSDGSVVAWG